MRSSETRIANMAHSDRVTSAHFLARISYFDTAEILEGSGRDASVIGGPAV